MKQLPLFDFVPPVSPVVNVASVTQRSLFRYPGGKTWLVPIVRRWLGTRNQRPVRLIEPFAGGAIIGLTAAFEQLAEKVTLVELDEQVGAVWQTLIEDGNGEWLCQQILGFEMTGANVDCVLSQVCNTTQEMAFQTIVRNRVNRGGILAPGAGRVKTGESGKGLTSRWYPETLCKRIRDIDAIRERLHFIQGDGLRVIQGHLDAPSIVFFIDPPYTAGGKQAGRRLYNHTTLDHEALFDLAKAAQGDFLMTYDDNDTIRALAVQHGFDVQTVAMKNTHHSNMNELLIGRDLTWLCG